MTRPEHLQWCKDRALTILDEGNVHEAYASFASDMNKHDETADHMALELGLMLLLGGFNERHQEMRDWIEDPNPNVRRAVTEGLRVWTSRPYFRDHPDIAVQLLSQLKDDDSEYVRKSVGNALRDISRKHRELVRAELHQWDVSKKSVKQTYRLASKFL